MIRLRAEIKEGMEDFVVNSSAELERTLALAESQARAAGKLNVIFLRAANGDRLSVVVGGAETVLGFTYGHGDPPYYASTGDTEADQPVLTAFVGLAHHTEFPRRYVVPMENGRQAAAQFLQTGDRPAAVQWVAT